MGTNANIIRSITEVIYTYNSLCLPCIDMYDKT